MARQAKISKIKKIFAEEYLRNGNNASAAYLSIKPDIKYVTAAKGGNRWLNDDKVKAYIEERQNEMLAKGGADREWVMNEILQLIENCKHNDDRQTLLKSLDVINKMSGNYVTKQEITHKGIVFNFIEPTDVSYTEQNLLEE